MERYRLDNLTIELLLFWYFDQQQKLYPADRIFDSQHLKNKK
jgi:hypothetical protein